MIGSFIVSCLEYDVLFHHVDPSCHVLEHEYYISDFVAFFSIDLRLFFPADSAKMAGKKGMNEQPTRNVINNDNNNN